jgi:hypothetical protein
MVLQANLAHQEAHEMLSSKTRTAIVALIAASSFATMAVVPAASQAAKINPARNAAAKQAAHKQAISGVCTELREMLNEDLQRLDAAHRAGNTAEATQERERANDAYKTGYEGGCGFAS